MAYFVNASGVEFEVLSKGEHTIGRGPLLKITDKRVSRNHATVKVNDDNAVSICPRHTNPCYYKPSGREEQIQLKKDNWQALSDGDQISILHYNIKDLVYTLRITFDPKKEALKENATLNVEEKKEKDNEEESNSDDSDTVKEKPLIVSSDDRSDPSNSLMLKQSLTTEKKKKTRVLPAWMLSAASAAQTPNDEDTEKLSPPPKKRKTSTKTSGSSSSASATNIKKTKETKITSKSSPKPKKTTTKDDEASPPTRIDSDEFTETDKKKDLPACPYGNGCYRKNPIHFQEYSHNDVEEDDGMKGDSNDEADKPECQYGTSCYRKNPLHRQQFNHSKSPAAPDSRKRATRTSTRSTRGKKPKKSVLIGDSDDDGESNSYDYNDSFIDDVEEEGEDDSSTSYGADSDEDADWAPMEDSEEISELLSDAKEFVSNSKMQK